MATWDHVRRAALALPETTEQTTRGTARWLVRERLFVWERPLRRSDLLALGPDAPEGDLLAARVPDLGAKEAWLADAPDVLFTIPHFDGFPAVLARLDALDRPLLDELVVEAWMCRAPKRVVDLYLADTGASSDDLG